MFQQDIDSSGANKEAIKLDLLDLAGEETTNGGVAEDARVALQSFVKVCDIVMEQFEIRRRAVQRFRVLDADNSGFLENTELLSGE